MDDTNAQNPLGDDVNVKKVGEEEVEKKVEGVEFESPAPAEDAPEEAQV